MPNKYCVICKRLQTIPVNMWKGLDEGDFVCSADCTFVWVKQHDLVLALKSTALSVPQGDACACYSQRLGMTFRSLYERYFAEESARREMCFEYEKWTFRTNGGTYTPDFWFPDHGCFVEVKGLWGVGAKKKLRKFREQYPQAPLLVVPWWLQGDFYPR